MNWKLALPGADAARELKAALAGSAAFVASLLSQGLLAYAALGAAGPALGLRAAFTSVVLGGLVFAFVSRNPVPAAGPGSATVLIYSSLVLQIVSQPGFDIARPRDVALLLSIMAAAVVGMGLLQMLFAALGLARLAGFVPKPVLAGYMNGVSVLIVLAQLPFLLGWPAGAWRSLGSSVWAMSLPAPLALAALTAATIWLVPRWLRGWPPTLLGLLVGAAAAALLALTLPGVSLGARVGSLPTPWPDGLALSAWLGPQAATLLSQQGGAVLATALVLATVGSLETVLNGLAIGQTLNQPIDPKRELLASGASNVLSGAFGGLPVVLMRSRALPTALAGGRTRWSSVLGCLLLAVAVPLGLPWLASLPKAVLAGVMVTLAVALMDGWSRDGAALWWGGQRSTELRLNLVVVAVVCGTTVALGLLTGLGVGVMLAMLLFIRSMNRSLLGARSNGAAMPSRRVYGPEQEAWLLAQRARIVIIELRGALFFGSAERLASEGESLPADTHSLVLDFRRVSSIDASGSVLLQQLAQRLAGRGVTLRLAGVVAGNRHGLALQTLSGTAAVHAQPAHWHADVDHAVEAAEQSLLAGAGLGQSEACVPLADSSLGVGLSAVQLVRLQSCMTELPLAPGEALFSEGDAGDRLYVLMQGSVTLYTARSAADSQRQRYLSVSPGMVFGEAAMLDGQGRSASAVADQASRVAVLTHDQLQVLQQQDPALASLLHRNLAVHLAQRLRAASNAWRASAR